MNEYTLINRFTERYKMGASECEIKRGENFEGRELGVEEKKRM
jgi:hypothetical protein